MELKDNAAAYCEAQLREIRIEAESLNRLIGKMSDQVATDGSRSFSGICGLPVKRRKNWRRNSAGGSTDVTALPPLSAASPRWIRNCFPEEG